MNATRKPLDIVDGSHVDDALRTALSHATAWLVSSGNTEYGVRALVLERLAMLTAPTVATLREHEFDTAFVRDAVDAAQHAYDGAFGVVDTESE